MKLFVTLLTLTLVPLFAETMRVPSGGYCTITTVSTAGVITYDSGGSCAPVEGQVIFITGVREGNHMHPVNSRPDTNHRYRKIKTGTLNTGTRTFQVTDMADTDVSMVPPGGGSAVSGTVGYFGAMSSAYTIRPEKGGFWDGPTGTKTLALADASRKAGPAYTALNSMVGTYKTWRASNAWGGIDALSSGQGFGERGVGSLSSILKYLADSTDTTARDVAIADLKAPEQMIGTASCDETVNNCGLPATTYADYTPSNFALWHALTATLVEGETGWGSADRERISRLWLNDRCWYEGGLGDTNHCPGQSPGPYNALSWKIHSSAGSPDYTHGTTLAASANTSTVTISGGDFVADGVAVGDIIFLPHPSESGSSLAYKISAVTSTTVTTSIPLMSGVSSGQHYAIGRSWTEADMGMAFQRNHFGPGYQYACGNCFYYQPQTGGSLDVTHNLPLVRMMGEMSTGMYACGSNSDQVGCFAAERSAFWYYHFMYKDAVQMNAGGYNSTKFFYNEWRMHAAHGMIWTYIRNWLDGGPNWNISRMLQDMSQQWRHMYYPGRGVGPWMPFTSSITANYYMTPLFSMYNYPADAESTYAQNHIINIIGGYDSSHLSYNKATYAWWHYALRDPTITTATGPTGAGKRSYNAECKAIWSDSQCDDIGRTVVSSRTGWTSADSIGQFVAASISASDQVDQNGTSQVTLIRNNIPLIWGDVSTGYGGASTGTGSILQVGTSGMPANSYPNPGTVTAPWISTGTSHTFARAVLTGVYSGVNVTAAERQWARVGNVFLVHDYVTTSSGQTSRARYHLSINGCGTVSSSSCITLSQASRTIASAYPSGSPTAGMLARAVEFSPNTVALVTEGGTDTNFSYTGGAGLSGRVILCSSTDGATCANRTSHEAAMVMETSNGTGSIPAVATSTAGSHRIMEIASATPTVVALTAGGTTSTSVSFATTHASTGNYLVAGLPSGTFTATRNGSAVSGSPFTVVDGENSIFFTSASGTIAIASTTAPLSIDTTSLPDGAVGTSYSQTLSASGGTPAYAWDLSTGSLPPGLTLNSSTGAITGTPTTAGTYNFTARVTDADTNTDTQALSITIPTPSGPGYRLVLRGGLIIR